VLGVTGLEWPIAKIFSAMFSRVLFLLMLASNIGLAAWLWLSPSAAATVPPVHDAGVAPLVLLSERSDLVSNAAELAERPYSAAELGALDCHRLGPFPSQADMRRAMSALTPITERIQFSETRSIKSRGWWVYMPAFPTRDLALRNARALAAKGVRDYYVVTAGDQQNTISLGLFRERSNAENRRADLIGMGFDAAMRERTDEAPEYWLEYAVAPEQSFNWKDRVPDANGITGTPTACS
jgi:hypothetical protein